MSKPTYVLSLPDYDDGMGFYTASDMDAMLKATFPVPVVRGKKHPSKEFFWCRGHKEVFYDYDGDTCGSACSLYKPMNGKSGRCTHHRRCSDFSDWYGWLMPGGRVWSSAFKGYWEEHDGKFQYAKVLPDGRAFLESTYSKAQQEALRLRLIDAKLQGYAPCTSSRLIRDGDIVFIDHPFANGAGYLVSGLESAIFDTDKIITNTYPLILEKK